mgnify:CR=1 FL=1
MTALADAYRYCEEITRRGGPHFSVGFNFLPARKRNAIYAVYAFCRFADDIVDERQERPLEFLLRSWEEELARCYHQQPTHPITLALSDAVKRYPIPRGGFLKLLQGCRMDLLKNRYPTFRALTGYFDRVSTPIRDLSLPIFGCLDAKAIDLGCSLSTALQLTNIIRDIGEDLDRGRIYIPLDEIAQAGLAESEFKARTRNAAFLRLMRFQCKRIRAFFREAAGLIPLLEEDSRLTVSLMHNVYLALIDRIEAKPFDVLDRPIRLSRPERGEVVRRTILERDFKLAL